VQFKLSSEKNAPVVTYSLGGKTVTFAFGSDGVTRAAQ
jgi:hypothetical protein